MKKYFKKLYNGSKDDFSKEIFESLKKNQKRFIITANPETFMRASKDKHYHSIVMSEYTTIIPDGISLVKLSKKYKIKLKERITGVDMTLQLLKFCNELSKSIYLYGASDDTITSLVEKIKIEYPKINILGYKNGYNNDPDKVFKDILKKKPDVILVALGIPKQDLIISKYYDEFKKGIFMGVGGSFDVISGKKKRAPKIFIKLNLEWLYRIIKEPKRIGRFIKNNFVFLIKVVFDSK